MSIVLCSLNFILAVYSYVKNADIAHLATASIYSVTLGPIFGLLRWRFRRLVRYIPAILFTAMAIFISLSAVGINKTMIRGLEDGNEQFLILYGCYVISIYIFG